MSNSALRWEHVSPPARVYSQARRTIEALLSLLLRHNMAVRKGIKNYTSSRAHRGSAGIKTEAGLFRVSLSSILSYVGDKKLCLEEGEAIVDGRYIICCGFVKKTDIKRRLIALCLQTSDINGKPHEISVTLTKTKSEDTQTDFTV